MNIGFDAKRAYHNKTGLGHYSRTLIQSLSDYFPDNNYLLFNPKPSSLFAFKSRNIKEVLPIGFLNTLFRSAWRSSHVTRDFPAQKLDLYHGLSHELPIGIKKSGVKSVVTIHDLIHERYPEQYSAIDVKIYTRKFRYACANADRIIAISEQTRRDIIDFYQVDPSKIDVCYQSCNPAFAEEINDVEKRRIKERYNLPDKFFLSVGSIIERKNLLNVCKAVFLLRDELNIPLVVIGEGGKYKQQVKDYVLQNGLEKKILFLSENNVAQSSESFQDGTDFPAIYQQATAMIYPSFFEGFGIPILEALWSKTPVITSNVSCLPEAGGNAAAYVNPSSAEEIAIAMRNVATVENLADTMREKGWQHAQQFSQKASATNVMNVYKKILA